MKERIYLDNSSQTKPSELAVRAMMPYYEDHFGSPLSPHLMGQELIMAMEASLDEVRKLVQAKSEDQFFFTTSGTEAVNQVIYSAFCEMTKQHGKNHFVVRTIEDAAPILAISRLEDEGVFLQLAPTSKRGFLTQEAFIESISPRTALLSISWASAMSGVIQPLDEIIEICKQRKILLHIDASSVIGKLDVSFSELGCDFLTFCGNAIHAPFGTGVLFAKKERFIQSLILGSDINVPMLVALGEAAKLAKETESLYCTEVSRLRCLLEEGIKNGYPEARVLFEEEERVPHVTLISFPGIHAELLAFALNRKGVFASLGGGAFQLIEEQLTACGIDSAIARCALSFSLSRDTQEAEIERAIQIILETAKRMRRLSQSIVQEVL